MSEGEPQVTLNASPSAAIEGPLAAAPKPARGGEVIVTDKRGRKLTLKRPTLLQQFNLKKALGPAVASNPAWVADFNVLLWVKQVDGEPIMPPLSLLQAEALIAQLEEDAAFAVYKAMGEEFKEDLAEMQALIKNISGTTG